MPPPFTDGQAQAPVHKSTALRLGGERLLGGEFGAHEGSTPWLSTEDAARHLACSRDRLYDLVQLGKLKPRRDGRRLLFKLADLDAYLET
jgi:excisionase family DNA binding protein